MPRTNHHGELLLEVAPFLSVQSDGAVLGKRGEGSLCLRRPLHRQGAAPIVCELAGFEHQRVAPSLTRRHQGSNVGHIAKFAERDWAHAGEVLLLEQLVLHERNRARRRVHRRALRLDLCEGSSIHVLDLDGDNVDHTGELSNLGSVGKGAGDRVATHHARRRGQAQRIERRHLDAHTGSGLRHHATELPTAEHANMAIEAGLRSGHAVHDHPPIALNRRLSL